jgi:hypothetical protein
MTLVSRPEQMLTRLQWPVTNHDAVQQFELLMIHAVWQAQVRERAVLAGNLLPFNECPGSFDIRLIQAMRHSPVYAVK